MLLLLAQAFIPIQSHTRWAVSDNGFLVEVCTLQGKVQQPLQLGMAADDAGEHSDIPSPAMAFSQLLAAAVSSQLLLQTDWLALVSIETVPAVIGIPIWRVPRHTPIRAPPAQA